MENLKFEKKNNKAYLYSMIEDWNQPRIIVSYWLIDIDASILPDSPLIYKYGDTYIAKTEYKEYPLYINEYPDITEFIPIKPPKKSGYIWNNGKWNKV